MDYEFLRSILRMKNHGFHSFLTLLQMHRCSPFVYMNMHVHTKTNNERTGMKYNKTKFMGTTKTAIVPHSSFPVNKEQVS